MELVRKIGQAWLDFFFPKTAEVIHIESLTTEELTDSLPPAPRTESKDTIALLDYHHEVVREMIWELKYGGNKQVARKLGELLYDVLCEEAEERALFDSAEWQEKRPVLVPIPISDKRRFERGWNQSELVCKAALEHDKAKRFKYLPRHLAKLRHTDSQTHTASKKERLENIKKSMRVLHPPAVEGRCVFLVDDVLTTGATFGEAKRALEEAGAKRVICVALAH